MPVPPALPPLVPAALPSPSVGPVRVPDAALRWRVPAAALPFKTTAEVATLQGILGQSAGITALRRGVELNSPGYNVCVVGLLSTGRLGTVKRILDDLAPKRRSARDFVYVRNFNEPGRPQLLILPPGRGSGFRKDLLRLATQMVDEVPRILRSDDLRRARDRQQESAAITQHSSIAKLQTHARELGFVIAEREGEPMPVLLFVDEPPEAAGAPVGPKATSKAAAKRKKEEMEACDRAEVQVLAEQGKLQSPLGVAEVLRRFEILEEELADAVDLARQAITETARKVAQAEEDATRAGTRGAFAAMSKRWPAAREWLAELHDELVESTEWFDEEEPDHESLFSAFTANTVHTGTSGSRGSAEVDERGDSKPDTRGDARKRSREVRKTAPIVLAANPTWQNLFGGVEGEPGGADHRSLRAGALVDADGGFLVLNASDMLMEPGAWKVLKRALMFGEFDIQNPDSGQSPLVLRPESLKLDVKVILLADPATYATLYYADPDFSSIFKVKAEFEEDAPLTGEVVEQLAAFMVRIIDRESLTHLTRDAVAAVIEWAVRAAGVGGRITTELGTVADVLREACYEARGHVVTRAHVVAALRSRRERDDMPEKRVLEAMQRGAIRVELQGSRVGQINGLAVYHVGGHDFGRPLRITCTAGAGRAGVVSIERESRLSGKSHDKGMQILAGWLRSQFGQDFPLTFTAAIAFEQSYSMVDGDSASSAEIYVLMSALAQLPLRQDLAVTGSVNQFGEIQAIGGVNEKIEGFFAACSLFGLTGNQGVLIPADNLHDLCVSEAVVEACAAGTFHVYGVRHIDEGLAMLTGMPTGTLERGGYTPGSVYARVAERLETLFVASRRRR